MAAEAIVHETADAKIATDAQNVLESTYLVTAHLFRLETTPRVRMGSLSGHLFQDELSCAPHDPLHHHQASFWRHLLEVSVFLDFFFLDSFMFLFRSSLLGTLGC